MDGGGPDEAMQQRRPNNSGEQAPLLGRDSIGEDGPVLRQYDSMPTRVLPQANPVKGAHRRWNSERSVDYVTDLVRKQKVTEEYLRKHLGSPLRARSVLALIDVEPVDTMEQVDKAQKQEMQEDCAFLKKAFEIRKETEEFVDVRLERQRSVEVRLRDVSYVVPVDEHKGMIETITKGRVFRLLKSWKARRLRERDGERPHTNAPLQLFVLKDINLVLRPGRSYLVLGPPGSGKTSLLKAISSLLPESKHPSKLPRVRGRVEYNGLPMKNDRGLVLSNAVAFVDQIDRHEPRLTVEETFDFAYQCKGGTHRAPYMLKNSNRLDEIIQRLDEEKTRVRLTMEGFGLSHVADTYVGGADVRGISGGQRRRVTVGEMMMFLCPVVCGDEVSTGLDAASTYQIVRILSRFARVARTTQVVSLKQPSPEVVALFDELILLAEGMVIFAGPVPDAFVYFESIGFELPQHMDDADFLQAISTPDRKEFYWRDGPCPTAEQLSKLFLESDYGETIQEKLREPLAIDWSAFDKSAKTDEEAGRDDNGSIRSSGLDDYRDRYVISFWWATFLNCRRHFTIWRRDIRFVRANLIKNVVMGISVGMVFYKTEIVESILGVMFQSTLFIMLGASTAAPAQVDDRNIFYKHADHNFFPALSFVVGRTLAFIPQASADVLIFGTIIYYLVGLEPAVSSFLIFVSVLVVFTIAMSALFGVCTSIAPTKATVQALSAVVILLNMYFCGFLVAPEVIPAYYGWLYWWCPLSWAYRALLINEYLGPSYDYPVPGTDYTEGEWILLSKGFTFDGEPFGRDWIGYCFAYLCPFIVLMTLLAGLGLAYIRFEAGKDSGGGQAREDTMLDAEIVREDSIPIDIPFTPVHLTFEAISYEVKASAGKEKLKLLNDVHGHLKPGRMCALMGSSGAGKTTLMDVISLRKQSGIVSGEVRLNGHLQEDVTFRRCSGYVEQFDVQTPQLTVRETILFSAHLRLDASISYEHKERFVDQVITMMELVSLADTLVGDDDSVGLTFEQRKRLSIAVELAASPSVIFLDEPTSGLDSRAALLVVNSLRKIVSTGRTVCATIHQPSSAAFGMFDDLLLMQKGGQVVYFGELGPFSNKLVDYFESRGAKPINRGENPATWMLSAITVDRDDIDFVKFFEASDERKMLMGSIARVKAGATEGNKVEFAHTYALNSLGRNMQMRKRLDTIYWRSPAYNRSRLILSLVLSFLLSSVFLNTRIPEEMTETYISGIFSTIFMSFIITGIMAITTVLPVMLKVRDVFYSHRASGALNHWSLSVALASAEQGFILMSSAMYCAVFYFTIGLEVTFSKFVAFWGFFTFNLAINSYFGQAFMCLVRNMGTAGILCSVVIGMNNFFSGLIVRPQYLYGFWQVPYWITPGRYVYEGLIAPQFYDDHRTVVANRGSDFASFLNCTDLEAISGVCKGTVSQYMHTFFGGRFRANHTVLNALVLGLFLVLARVSTHIALYKFNHTSAG